MDRDIVWQAIVRHEGDREGAAEHLGCSVRTLNRWISRLNLYPDLDKAGYIKNPGPPRGVERGMSMVVPVIKSHIKKYKGEIDYGELAEELYGEDNHTHRHRVYTALSAMKASGEVAVDDRRWFLLRS